MRELIHGDFDISSQPDRMLPSSVVQSVVKPKVKKIPNVLRSEFVLIHDEGIGHA